MSDDPRQEYINRIDFLARETQRLGERVLALEDQAADLHRTWRELVGGTRNQNARDATVHLADLDEKLTNAVTQTVLAFGSMYRFAQEL